MAKKKTISHLKRLADSVFSRWIRVRDRRCFTCGSTQNLQCGHFVSRSCNILRYDEENCHAQCVGCNVFKNGNMAVYAYRMQQKYGNEILKELFLRKQELHQFKRQELEEIISKYAL